MHGPLYLMLIQRSMAYVAAAALLYNNRSHHCVIGVMPVVKRFAPCNKTVAGVEYLSRI